MKNDGKTVDSAEKSLSGRNKTLFTTEQQTAIDADGKVLVSASAGSGKTTTMVEKILRCVEEGVSLADMLILVYNESAAGELRDKLQSALFDAACTASFKERGKFRSCLDALSTAHIGTIHSFCYSLIKANFEKLGVSPACDVLSAGEAKRYDDLAMDEVFARYYAEGDEVFMRLADVLTRSRREDELRKVVEKVYAVIAIQPDRQAFARKLCDGFDGALDSEYAEAALAFMRRDVSRVREGLELSAPVYAAGGYPLYAEKMRLLAELCAEAEGADVAAMGRLAERCADIAGMTVESRVYATAVDPDDKSYANSAMETVTELFAEWRERFGDVAETLLRHEQNALFARKLVEIALRTDEEVSAMKRADEVMSYEDLEYYAAELVKDGSFKGSFKKVFVDEYQDVNPVQDFIIRGVSGDNVFMVGDVKQSIYGFRLSDPEIFLGRKRLYEESGEGKALEFNANFRSVNAVLDFVNRIFDEVMTEESSGVDYAKEGHFVLGEGKKDAAGEPLSGDAQVHIFPYAGNTPAPGVYAAASFIAEKIGELRASARKDDGSPITFGDCTVLIRGRSGQAKKLAAYLADNDIPVDTSVFSEQSSRAENELLTFLAVLDNPRQDIPLAGFMLSCFGGFDESETARIAAMRGENDDLYDAVLAAAKQDTPLGRKVAAMLDMLAVYRLKASFKSVPELLQSIVSDFDYDALIEGLGEGSADKVISFVTSRVSKDSYAGIGRFLAAYETQTDEGKRARPQGGDKVRFATFHSYKGLESPVVFVFTTGRSSSDGYNGDVIVENKGYMGLKYFDFAGRKKGDSLSMYAVERIRDDRERMEEMRLYYVALTRAKQYLYITCALSRTPATRFGRYPLLKEPEMLPEYLSEVCRKGRITRITHETAEDVPDIPQFAELPPFGVCSPSDEEAVARAVSFEYPHRAARELAMKYSVSALDGGDEELTPGAFADRVDEGIVYHRVMEHIDYAAKGEEGVRAELADMVKAGFLTDEERAQVDVDAIVRCLDSPVMRLARESKCYRERSFLMYVPAKEVGQGESEDKVLVQGVIDLLIDGKERVIVDFKNSALRSAEAMEKYKKQLYLYKKAVESSFLGKVDRIVLYSFKTGRTIDL